MTRTFLAACAALALGLAASLTAQSGDMDHSREARDDKEHARDITVTGCLQRNRAGGFWLTDARLGSGRDDDDRRELGTSGTESSEWNADLENTRTFNLENGKNLNRLVGRRVRVVGRAEVEMDRERSEGTTRRYETEARDLDVRSVKSIGSSCS
jgi:hypothetical protein